MTDPIETDIEAYVNAAVAKALVAQGAPVVSPEAAAASVAAVTALRNQPAVGENQALTSNPHPDAVAGISGTAVVVSVGEPDNDESVVATSVGPAVTTQSNVGVTATAPVPTPTSVGTATYVPVTTDQVTGA